MDPADFLKNRREFLYGLGSAAAALGGAAWLAEGSVAEAAPLGPMNDRARVKRAIQVRTRAAQNLRRSPSIEHVGNGDEELYPNLLGSFTKGLPHNNIGEVLPQAYAALLRAVKSGRADDFEAIPTVERAKFVSPLASYAVLMEGFDPCSYRVPPAPKFSSALQAAEMAEVYWMALARDVPFTDYASNPLINQAAADLSRFSDYNGLHASDGTATPQTLFRGTLAGDDVGPYISQFLLKNIRFGSITVEQKSFVPTAGLEYLTRYDDFLTVQNGRPQAPLQLDPTPRYLRNLRDLGQYVHIDFAQQEVLTAGLLLLLFGEGALNPANPYLKFSRQDRFTTFGGPGLLDLALRVIQPALTATWFQKWCVHRRTRPEEFAGRVHIHRTGAAAYPIDASILNSPVLDLIFSKHGTYLLPAGYPEGCPLHPAYPGGHSTFTGASATVLKALFNENFIIPNPVEASLDGLSLVPYSGPPLTAGGELNKMASNVALGRDAMGVHWRTDGIEGILLGEAMVISILRDYKETFNEGFASTFTGFDGKTVNI